MIRAFRDTWELGIHSYVTYLRDRLRLCRELLHESGSVFGQIGDENVHLVRCVMDEVFGRKNFVSLISVKKTATLSRLLDSGFFYIIWYASDAEKVKYHQLYLARDPKQWLKETPGGSWGIEIDGRRRPIHGPAESHSSAVTFGLRGAS